MKSPLVLHSSAARSTAKRPLTLALRASTLRIGPDAELASATDCSWRQTSIAMMTAAQHVGYSDPHSLPAACSGAQRSVEGFDVRGVPVTQHTRDEPLPIRQAAASSPPLRTNHLSPLEVDVSPNPLIEALIATA